MNCSSQRCLDIVQIIDDLAAEAHQERGKRDCHQPQCALQPLFRQAYSSVHAHSSLFSGTAIIHDGATWRLASINAKIKKTAWVGKGQVDSRVARYFTARHAGL
jgi:hypothetical protein